MNKYMVVLLVGGSGGDGVASLNLGITSGVGVLSHTADVIKKDFLTVGTMA